MNRRTFVKQAAIITPFVIALAAMRSRIWKNLPLSENFKNRKLVLIELAGGNDGLNTVIPLDKYNILSQVRKDILIPESKVLKLRDTNSFGFHPSMTGLQELYNNKLVTIIEGVGLPVPELSHFYAKAIKYMAGSGTGRKELRSGWAGRYLQQQYPKYPQGYPIHPTDGPAAIRIDEVSPRITQFVSPATQEVIDISIGINSLADLETPVKIPADPVENNLAGENINKIRSIYSQLALYSPIVHNFAQKQQNLSKLYPEPGINPLADQLKIIARLIGSGLNTPVYIVSHSGYDTHADQVDRSDPTRGVHAALLKDLSEAIFAFEDDLHLMGKQDEVLGMTFSEFGRRISSGSYGTDHGTSESAILFGTQLKNGIVGSSPQLPEKITYDDNLPVQFDFRTVYKSVLHGWMGAADENVNAIISGPETKLDLFHHGIFRS